ncbi:hypothetical protein COV53_04625 [Candidatus Gottesmanbacteria bacterium CG11_big_fil_rev_8_21_14_0_20_37_11]|uniref:Uncharacterized protein n=3 Tax=Candidatus Gottesmaniibacteriota TaxID=1752720 RepID=A0A2M7RQ24_9BACT|nr:MAG: hypothetical protein AUJ73_04345 [Candidatus Gottesmanbacteria bacterium CG1_02_37_22]PIP32246.1 MAG: hypothetical protein COX23_05780 [Candidatus Gottesmanbacteria bacterium CG23_combo_of_CG06-09_8_20_14_all_37_19]PIR08129.1 MAG: hypothetical protein COV53_04625 [Candidatus Gottesmanbacteria bacterium CG11_big_fil_rev_8_21_14_0_20_37_11]PIZ02165.1 MAG: hypothetical protein COY59_06245 [Candidatus Gottesmanbacteria bacterium CG_4_10_14_0_8_um_filter_37_24]
MFHLSKKFVILLLSFLLLSAFFISPKKASADVSVYDYSLEKRANQDAEDEVPGSTPINYRRVSDYQLDVSSANLTCKIVPCPIKCQKDGKDTYCMDNKPTAIGTISNLMADMYANPPASFALYMEDALANAGLVERTYAQGIGFTGLTAFLPFWKVTRDVAYIAIMLVMLAIGVMIIFRTKIDPKTIISVQAAIPKIVVTLIVVTLSYPIVGLLIDLMYLVIAIVIAQIAPTMTAAMGPDIPDNTAELQQTYMTGGFFDLFGAVFWPARIIILTLSGFPQLSQLRLQPDTAQPLTGISTFLFFFPGLSAKFISIAGGSFIPGLGLAVALPSLILLLIVVLGFLFTFIRLFMILLNSYIQIIISLILGPIILLAEAFPGKSAFGGWIMNILSNLVVFPATVVIIMFSVFLSTQGQLGVAGFSPPFIAGAGNNFHAILGLGVMLMAPNLVLSIKKLFSPKPSIPMTAGTLLSPLTGAFQTTMSAASQFYYLNQMKTMLPGQKSAHQER